MEQLFEEWADQFANKIPFQNYSMKLEIGEENGLIIRLFSEKYHVMIDFGVVEAVNVLDEGVQLNDPWNCDGDIIPENGLKSTIYLIKNGRYLQYIKQCMGDVLTETFKQYNIITLNYVIMVIGRYDPTITLMQRKI